MTALPQQDLHPDSSIRQAALLLYAMAFEDREWVLAALPRTQRIELLQLIDELYTLGIPADSSLLDAILKDQEPVWDSAVSSSKDPFARIRGFCARLFSTETVEVPNTATQLTELNDQQARLLAHALRAEPPFLLARLLYGENWSWRQAFLSELGSPRSGQIECYQQELEQKPQPQALQQALVNAVQHRLAQVLAPASDVDWEDIPR